MPFPNHNPPTNSPGKRLNYSREERTVGLIRIQTPASSPASFITEMVNRWESVCLPLGSHYETVKSIGEYCFGQLR